MNPRTLELVRAAMQGNRDSYGALVKDHTGFIYSMAFRMTGDHHLAEDACQETFLKGWLKIGDLKQPSTFSGWLATIARRTCLNMLEKRKRHMELGEEEIVLDTLNPTLPRSWDPTRKILEEAIMQLPLQDRELLTLCYFRELESPEVAEVLGIPPGTVRVYLHRARKKLHGLLKGREDEFLG